MKFKGFKKFIVVDRLFRPMAWYRDQFYYCDTETWEDDIFPIKIYSESRARKLIEQHKKFRLKTFKEKDVKLFLMPIKEKK